MYTLISKTSCHTMLPTEYNILIIRNAKHMEKHCYSVAAYSLTGLVISRIRFEFNNNVIRPLSLVILQLEARSVRLPVGGFTIKCSLRLATYNSLRFQ